jgi:TRAP-type C4-dicarboxylate transport system permease small subunit
MIDRLRLCLGWLAATMLIASVVINFANILGRYVFFAPIDWAEEVL